MVFSIQIGCKVLFYLDNSIKSVLEDSNNEYVISSIHQILEAWVSGNHLMFAERELINSMIEGNFFQGRDAQIIRKFKQNSIQMGNLFNFKWYVKVVGHESAWEEVLENGKKIIQIGYKKILNYRITDQALLILEDLRDEEIYKRIVKSSLIKKRDNMRLSYFPINGGGSRIYESYNKYQKENNKLFLCIADSEALFPNDNYGETARKLLETKELNPSILSDVWIINAQEIENLIPTSIYEEIINGNMERSSFIKWLKSIENINPKSRLFVDIKNGFSFLKILNKSKTDTFWVNILKDDLDECDFLTNGQCFPDSCECCYKIPGLGDPLPEVISYIDKISPHKFAESCQRNRELVKLWDEISELFFYWFCADEPQIVFGDR